MVRQWRICVAEPFSCELFQEEKGPLDGKRFASIHGARLVAWRTRMAEENGGRCGDCPNCLRLEKVKLRVLACCNPPFSHADDDVVEVWNKELESLPCVPEDLNV